MQTFAAFLLAAGGALAVFSFARPSSTARAILFTLFLAVVTLAAMVLSVHALLTEVASAN